MQIINDNNQASRAITETLMLHGSTLTPEQREKVLEYGTSVAGIAQFCDTAEYLYSERETISNEWRDLGAALARYCAQNGWHHLGRDGRGEQVVGVMARLMGEKPPAGKKWPKEDEEPAVDYRFRPDAVAPRP